MREPSPFWQSFSWAVLATVSVFAAQLPMFAGAKGWVENLASVVLGMVLVSRPGDTPLSAVRRVVQSMRPTPVDHDPC